MEIIGLLILFVGFISAGIFWRFKRDDFLARESDRCLNRFCEVDSNWNSEGRVYAKGLAVIEEGGEKKICKASQTMRYRYIKVI